MNKRVKPLICSFGALICNIAGWGFYALNFLEIIDSSFELAVTILIINAVLIIASLLYAVLYREYEDSPTYYPEDYVTEEYGGESSDGSEVIDFSLEFSDSHLDFEDKSKDKKRDDRIIFSGGMGSKTSDKIIIEKKMISDAIFFEMQKKDELVTCRHCGVCIDSNHYGPCKVCGEM